MLSDSKFDQALRSGRMKSFHINCVPTEKTCSIYRSRERLPAGTFFAQNCGRSRRSNSHAEC